MLGSCAPQAQNYHCCFFVQCFYEPFYHACRFGGAWEICADTIRIFKSRVGLALGIIVLHTCKLRQGIFSVILVMLSENLIYKYKAIYMFVRMAVE